MELLLLAGLIWPSLAQTQSVQEDLLFLLDQRPANVVFNLKKEPAPAPLPPRGVSEFKLLFLSAIRVYQTTISSQDLPTCAFAPSCSRFSNDALQQAGWWRGLFLTSDRLQRCNGLPGMARQYPFVPRLRKFSDPIERYVHTGRKETDE